jgi:uncharacterized damage-inducible protein DinB
MKIKDLLNEDVVKIMSEETLVAIQEAFDKKVELTTEAALVAQDELYAEKLDQLIKTIDRDHSVKMKRIVSAIDQDRTQKLIKVVKKYETALNEGSKGVVSHVVGAVSSYLDSFLNESFSKEDFSKAVKNTSAMNVLERLRSTLAVDSVMMKESVQEAVLDGKSRIDSLQNENSDLKNKLKVLEEEFNNIRVNSLIEEKISKMSDDKKSFVRKTLKDKSFDFISENFDYVSRLFDKKEKEKIKTITEDAKKRKIDVDFIPEQQKVVTESINNNNDDAYDPYVSELAKVFGNR